MGRLGCKIQNLLGFACLLILIRFVYCLVVSYIDLLCLFVVFTYINMLFMILCFQMIRVFLLIFLYSMAAMCSAQPPWMCRDCVVNGIRYRGNHAFQYNHDCNQYTCKCFCDGTHCLDKGPLPSGNGRKVQSMRST